VLLGRLGSDGRSRAISRNGAKIVFEEEGQGGGPNYTVFLRDTDGSPPLKIGDGLGMAFELEPVCGHLCPQVKS